MVTAAPPLWLSVQNKESSDAVAVDADDAESDASGSESPLRRTTTAHHENSRLDISDSEDNGSFVLQRTSTVTDAKRDLERCEALPAALPAYRVMNTFIHVDEENARTLSTSEANEAPGRTKSDPLGRKYSLPNCPTQVPGISAVPEAAEGESSCEDEEDDGQMLERFATFDHFASQQLPQATHSALPWAGNMQSEADAKAYAGSVAPQFLLGLPFYGVAPVSAQWPISSQPMSQGPEFGMEHSFHSEVKSFGKCSPDLRSFTKGEDFEGRLSVLSGSQVQHGGVQRYLMQFSAGQLSKADGVGFVFASRVPCAKNIQKIVSVFVNQRGRICMRVFGDILRAKKHVRTLRIGDWIEMIIDLERSVATFKVWANEYAGEPDSTAEFHYGQRLSQANQASAKPVKLNVGHFACVVQNVGVTMTMGS
eukprot:TRINITY_DN106426_c0_g1_i1.p1 TRINITY_DN106426_c0_g1~~TRINITY_DN106426_c0_g1_i1.p1  ORF type:complete len:450 (-),score=73.12 TRINITY_DN106426_c0_g1_i1:234-1505(-)